MTQNFVEPIPLELERIKAIRIQWKKCLLKVRNEALHV